MKDDDDDDDGGGGDDDDADDVPQVGSEASKLTTGRLPEAPLFVARSPADKNTDYKVQWLERYQELNPSSTVADASQGTLWILTYAFGVFVYCAQSIQGEAHIKCTKSVLQQLHQPCCSSGCSLQPVLSLSLQHICWLVCV